MATRAAVRISPEEAGLERIRREKARRHLRDFGLYVLPWWKPAAVHELITSELEEVYRYIDSGGIEGNGSLIIEMPPQHGKTTIVSQLFPAWLMGKRPDSRVILTAYIADLSQENSRQVRTMVTGERYAAIFGQKSVLEEPVQISGDSTSRASWNLADPYRGGLMATGVGGGTTGKSADLIVVDDPFKNREEGDNPLVRQKILKWMTSSVLSRTRARTAIVIIHTRWHREDLIGEMLKSTQTDAKARQWKVMSLPAFPLEANEYAQNEEQQEQSMLEGLYKPFRDPLGREPGSRTPLWDVEFPTPVLEQIQATLAATGQISDWYALYLQQPRPSEGAFFSANDFQLVERAPVGLRWVRYVDLALSTSKTADFNATVAVALDDVGNLYLRDMLRVQGWNEFKEQLKSLMVSDYEKGTQWALEDVAFQALAFQELMRERSLVGVAIRQVRPEGDKVQRARPLQTRAKAGKVFLVKGPWVQQFLLEALDFPNGRHDDQVDTASGGIGLLSVGPAILFGA